jgi:hypothetical protein
MEEVIVGILALSAIAYIVISIRRFLEKPECLRKTYNECPYARSVCGIDSFPFSCSCNLKVNAEPTEKITRQKIP